MTSAGTPGRPLTDRVRYLLSQLQRTCTQVFDALLPAECLGCRETHLPAEYEDPVCPNCLMKLRPMPWPRCERCHAPRGTGAEDLPCLDCREWPEALTRARSAVVHEEPATRLISALKYQGWPVVADVMARPMGLLDAGLPPGPLVPVPTTPARARRRGYNQAEVLAAAVARRTGRRVRNLLQRRPLSASQVALQRWQRLDNVHQAFFVPPDHGSGLREDHVILLDDVLTTGATASAAAEALACYGVPSISLLTFARALPFERRPGLR